MGRQVSVRLASGGQAPSHGSSLDGIFPLRFPPVFFVCLIDLLACAMGPPWPPTLPRPWAALTRRVVLHLGRLDELIPALQKTQELPSR